MDGLKKESANDWSPRRYALDGLGIVPQEASELFGNGSIRGKFRDIPLRLHETTYLTIL